MSSTRIHCCYTIPAATAAKSLQSCPTLCVLIDGSPPGSPVPGILQARTLEWVVSFFSNVWNRTVKMKSLSLIWLLATPWTAAYQGSSTHGIFQARVLEWGAIAFSGSVTLTISKCNIKINHVVKYFPKSLKYSVDHIALICAWMDVS